MDIGGHRPAAVRCDTRTMRQTERRPTSVTIRQLQGEAFLRDLDGKILDRRITDVLYDNPFALDQMAKGLLRLTIVVHEGKVKDYVEYDGCDLTG